MSVAERDGDGVAVVVLLMGGADFNAVTTTGWTALMGAAEHGRKEVVSALIDSNADVNATDGLGGTALMAAAAAGHLRVVEALLEAGANVHANKIGGTGSALTYAERNGHDDVVRVLKSAVGESAPSGGL